MSTATISCSTPDAIIRYEIGGVDPTESSPLYSSPVEFSGEIRAKAWKEGYESSDIAVAVALEEDEMTNTWVSLDMTEDDNATYTIPSQYQMWFQQMYAQCLSNNLLFELVATFYTNPQSGGSKQLRYLAYNISSSMVASVKFIESDFDFDINLIDGVITKPTVSGWKLSYLTLHVINFNQ